MNLEIDVEKLIKFCEDKHYDAYSGVNLSYLYINPNPNLQIDYSNYKSLKETKQNGYYLHGSVIEHLVNTASVNGCYWLKNYHYNMSTFVSQLTNISHKVVSLENLEPEKGYRMFTCQYNSSSHAKVNTPGFLSKDCNECKGIDCHLNQMLLDRKSPKEIYVELAEQYYEERGVLNFKLYSNYILKMNIDISINGIYLTEIYLENKFNSQDKKIIDKHIDRFEWEQTLKASIFYYVNNSIIDLKNGDFFQMPINDVYQFPTIFYKIIKDNLVQLTPNIINVIQNLEEYIYYCNSTTDNINLNFK